jgi:hypothetical protein
MSETEKDQRRLKRPKNPPFLCHHCFPLTDTDQKKSMKRKRKSFSKGRKKEASKKKKRRF